MTSAGASPRTETATRFGVVFAVVAAGVIMTNLDMFIVNVALPDISAAFGRAPLSTLSWVLNAYAVVFAAWLIPAGSVADRTSARRTFLLGIAAFTVASALCAAAPTIWLLVVARVLQAVGAAMLIPSSLGILMAAAPPGRRMGAIRGWTGLSGFAAAAGPVLGGLLTQIDWRWVFLINVPIGIAAIVVGLRVLPEPPRKPATGSLDVLGAALLTISIGLLSLALVNGSAWGWTSAWVLGSLVVAVVLLVGFVVRSSRHPSPVLPLSLLGLPAVRPASAANFLLAIAFGAMLLSIVLWCQNVWGWSALITGLAVAPGPLMVPFLAAGAGPLIARVGAGRISSLGCAVFAAGIGWWIGQLGATPDYVGGVLPGMLLTGIGVGLALPTLIGTSISSVPPPSFSTGSALVTMIRQIGSVLGVALLVITLGSVTTGNTASSFDNGWWLTLGAAVAAGLACLFIPRPEPAAA